jgi:hypothetical protein
MATLKGKEGDEKKDMRELDDMVDAEVKRCVAANIKFPFLAHVQEFAHQTGPPEQVNTIDESSIAERWTALTGQGSIVSKIKAKITISGANFVRAYLYNKPIVKDDQKTKKQKDGGCPYLARFGSAAELMPNLKHPCDSGVVMANGSIHADRLKYMMRKCFQWDGTRWKMTLSAVTQFIKDRGQEDKHVEPKITGWLPSWETVAANEWIDAFGVYCDGWELDPVTNKHQPTMSAQRLLQFYFDCKTLNDDVRKKLLPVPKPASPSSSYFSWLGL